MAHLENHTFELKSETSVTPRQFVKGLGAEHSRFQESDKFPGAVYMIVEGRPVAKASEKLSADLLAGKKPERPLSVSECTLTDDKTGKVRKFMLAHYIGEFKMKDAVLYEESYK